MNLTEEQKTAVTQWLSKGLGLAEVQKKLEEDFSIKLTFMDVRFLLDDLDLAIQDKPQAKVQPENSSPNQSNGPEAESVTGEPSLVEEGKGIQVGVDKVQKPGALASGTVVFSDGKDMRWQVDSMGRLGLIPGTDKDYRPSEADLMEFQMSLDSELQKHGF